MPDKHSTGAPWRNFYGRLKGKGLRDSQERYLAEDLQALAPEGVTWEDNPDRTPADLSDWFGDDRPVWLEVGFGGGEHMVHQATLHPEVGIIGCEPYINGVAMLLGKIRDAGVTNVKVHAGDARDMMDVLPDGSIRFEWPSIKALIRRVPPVPETCGEGHTETKIKNTA